MVRVTRAGENAILAMVRLAKLSDQDRVMIGDIAEAEGLSREFLAKQFQMLSRKGLVESTRGVGGGIALARPANEINLRQIFEAVEGPVALNRCLKGRGRCRRARSCLLAPVWREAQEKMLEVLGNVTLDTLMKK